MVIYDISQTIGHGITVWPGDQPFVHEWNARLKEGGATNLSAIKMSVHTGTHVDAPCHLFDGGGDVAGIPIQSLLGPARVVSLLNKQNISIAELVDLPLAGVERMLFRTRSAETEKGRIGSDFASLTEDAADFLIRQGVVLVGTDSPSVDAFANASLPVHKKLLSRSVTILEGLRLSEVPDGDYELICLPLKLQGADGSPVRAILRR